MMQEKCERGRAAEACGVRGSVGLRGEKLPEGFQGIGERVRLHAGQLRLHAGREQNGKSPSDGPQLLVVVI